MRRRGVAWPFSGGGGELHGMSEGGRKIARQESESDVKVSKCKKQKNTKKEKWKVGSENLKTELECLLVSSPTPA